MLKRHKYSLRLLEMLNMLQRRHGTCRQTLAQAFHSSLCILLRHICHFLAVPPLGRGSEPLELRCWGGLHSPCSQGHRCFLRSLLRGDNERLCQRRWVPWLRCDRWVQRGQGSLSSPQGDRCLCSALVCVCVLMTRFYTVWKRLLYWKQSCRLEVKKKCSVKVWVSVRERQTVKEERAVEERFG